MKVKTSITLSEELLTAIDELASPASTRSAFIEMALWSYIVQQQRAQQAARDQEIINQRAEVLNAETMDVLSYQVPL